MFKNMYLEEGFPNRFDIFSQIVDYEGFLKKTYYLSIQS